MLIFCLYDKCLLTALLRLCNNLYLKTLRFISSNMSISPEVARMSYSNLSNGMDNVRLMPSTMEKDFGQRIPFAGVSTSC